MSKISVTFQNPVTVGGQLFRAILDEHLPPKFINWILVFVFYTLFGITGIHRLLTGNIAAALLSVGSFGGSVYLILFAEYAFLGLLLLGLATLLYVVDLFTFLQNDVSIPFMEIWIPVIAFNRFFFLILWLCWVEFFISHYHMIPYVSFFVNEYLLDLMHKWIPFM
ncbi:MAG: hypothetical protein GF313_13695 [Caldithrix sp.]|nr:hypothetical protein [Caldithrix sp.]